MDGKVYMKLLIPYNGDTICIQVVKRGDSVYMRRCANTMDRPTERQLSVRRTLALAAIGEYDNRGARPSRRDIVSAVQQSFVGWKPTEKEENEIEAFIDRNFGKVKEVKMGYGIYRETWP